MERESNYRNEGEIDSFKFVSLLLKTSEVGYVEGWIVGDRGMRRKRGK